jgi:multidrug efflux pump subunit AcrA (membrane-fusion protein)
MAFCGECGTKAVGEFCINCGRPILIPNPGTDLSKDAATDAEQLAAEEKRIAEEAALKRLEEEQAARVEAERQAILEQERLEAEREALRAQKLEEQRQAEIQRQLELEELAKRQAEEAEEAEEQQDRKKEVIQEVEDVSEDVGGVQFQAEKKPKSLKPVAISAAAALLLAAVLFPSSGKLKVVFSDETSSNPPVALNLRVNGELVRIDAGRLRDGVIFEREWSVFQPIEVEVIPDPLDDEAVATSTLQVGTLGIWNLGRDLVVDVAAYDSWTEIDMTGPNNLLQNRNAEGSRTNFAMALIKCEADFIEQHAFNVNLIRQANANYVKYVKESQLDGDRTLTYGVWAARSNKLIDKLTAYIKLIESNPLPSPTSEHNAERETVLTDLTNLKTRWRGLANIAKDEDEDRWDGAWTLIYEEEDGLLESTKAFRALSEDAQDAYCQSKLVRK